VTASTKWWMCGQCGFSNHPRLKADTTKCEQCGADQKDESAVDVSPTGGF
jgi:ribosomal protein L37AE/L43A